MAEVTGVITHVLPKETGSSAKGEWQKQLFVIKTEEQYSKEICFEAWKTSVDHIKAVGTTVKVSYDISSREHNGKWYTQAKAFKIETVGAAAGEAKDTFNKGGFQAPSGDSSDLPFKTLNINHLIEY